MISEKQKGEAVHHEATSPLAFFRRAVSRFPLFRFPFPVSPFPLLENPATTPPDQSD